MSWIIAILLALVAFAIAAAAFRLPRQSWTSLLAALVFGLVGYTLQASPDAPAAPTSLAAEAYEDEWQVVPSRKLLVGNRLSSTQPAVLTSDAFAQRGRFVEAAGFLGNAVQQNPQDFEAWVALGNALTEKADGILTQASVYAYRQANMIAPDNPAPSYFLGLSLIRQGRMMEASQTWRGALEQMPVDDGEARQFLAERVERLDEMLAQAGIVPQGEIAE